LNKISIVFEDFTLEAVLYDNPTAEEIIKVLPLEATVHTWGDEIYFDIPVKMKPAADARVNVEVGELGYWPQGTAFCIFFGSTPVSIDEKPRAYSPVNIFGKVIGEVKQLKNVKNGARIRVLKG
jgi:hypothetical protein